MCMEFYFKHSSGYQKFFFSIKSNSVHVYRGNWLFLEKESYSLCVNFFGHLRHFSIVTHFVSTSEGLFLSLLTAPRFKNFRNPNGARDRTLGARKIVGKNTLYRFAVRESRDSFSSARRKIWGLERPTYLSFFTHYTSAVNDTLPLWIIMISNRVAP